MGKDTIDFKKLMHANNEAFRNMGLIREELTIKKNSKLVELTHEAFKHTMVMSEEYLKIEPEEKPALRTSTTNAYKNALDIITQATALIKANETETELYEKLMDEKNEQGIFKKIEDIPTEFEEEETFTLEPVQTLHGLIRYLHQKAITGTFDAKKLVDESELVTFNLNRGTFNFMDLDNQIAE